MDVISTQILSVSAMVLTLSAVALIAIPKRLGQYLGLTGNSLWFLYSLSTEQYPLMIQSIVLVTLSVIGVYNWSKKDIG